MAERQSQSPRPWYALNAANLRFVLICVAIGAIASSVYVFVLRGNYEAAAVLRFKDDIPMYRRLMSTMQDRTQLDAWASTQPNMSAAAVSRIDASIRRGTLLRQIEPFFPMTKRDMRDAPLAAAESGPMGGLAGIRVAMVGSDPDSLVTDLKVVAAYLRDSMISDALTRFIDDGYDRSLNKVRESESDVITEQFHLKQLQDRLIVLKKIRSSYPESDRIEARQIVSIAEGADRFLSPVAQVVGTESNIMEARQKIERLERTLESAKASLRFFERAQQAGKRSRSGAELLTQMQALIVELYPKSATEKSDVLRDVATNLNGELVHIQYRYQGRSTFLTGESVPVVALTGTGMAIASGMLLGLFGALLMLVWPRYLAWLRHTEHTPDEHANTPA